MLPRAMASLALGNRAAAHLRGEPARQLSRRAAGGRSQLVDGRAQQAGPEACLRVELLRLRFHEGLPIRAIAQRWQADAAALHHEYAKARREFKEALAAVVAFQHPGSPADVKRECASLLESLGQ